MKIDFDKIKDLHVVCIGDIMLDAFVYGNVDRLSPEAPVAVLKTTNTDYMLGGVGNVVVNLLKLGAKVTLFAMIGEDKSGQIVADMLQEYENLEAYVFVDPSIKTTTKTRYVSGKQHLIRIDDEEVASLNEEIETQAIQSIFDATQEANVLIISDYNKGFISTGIKRAIAQVPDKVFKIVDTKGDLKTYMGIDMVTPNIKELEKYSGMKIKHPSDISVAVDKFYNSYAIPNILVTASEHGMIFYNQIGTKPSSNPTAPTEPVWRVISEPSYNNNPLDVSGAGDTVVSSMAIGVGLGIDSQYSLELASHCAAIAISKRGTSYVELDELKEKYNLTKPSYRDYERVQAAIAKQKQNGKTVGFVNGCFDLLHAGHLDLLRQSKESCDYLVVAINADASVKAIKGESRPVVDELSRAELLESLKYVDAVVIFEEETPIEMISKFVPDFIFKGKEYETRELREQAIADEISASFVFFETVEQSTTAIIKKIKDE